jgi:hypothetical protein
MLASQVTVPAPWRRSRQDRRRRQSLRGEVAAAQQLRGYIGAISYSRSREIDGAQPSKASSPVVTGNVTGVGGNPAAYIVSLNLKRRHLDERQRALVAAKIANMRSSTRTDLEPPANLPQESCELDHVLHPERMIAWRCQTTGFDHARHTQLPLPRILPCPPRRNAKTASSGLG